MLGAICGDVIGSRHEFNALKSIDFELLADNCRWTDDTVCTLAVADAIMSGEPVSEALAKWVRTFEDAGYGLDFFQWALREQEARVPYGSWGNGSAMRVSSVPWLVADLGSTARVAAETAAPTHNNHHGIRGAKATAVAVRMALEGWRKHEIANVVTDRFGYDLTRHPDVIRPNYRFHVSCQRSVPEALCCLMAASSWEETVRLAVSLGGDADTQCAIVGAVAEPLFGIPTDVAEGCLATLAPAMTKTYERFRREVDGRSYPKTDPEAVARDLPPHRDGPDPFSDEAAALEMARMEAVQNSIAASETRRRRGIPGRIVDRIRGLFPST